MRRSRSLVAVMFAAIVVLAACGDGDRPRPTLPGGATVPSEQPPADTEAQPPADTEAPPPVVTDAPPPVITGDPPAVTEVPPPVVTEVPPPLEPPADDESGTTWWPWLLGLAAVLAVLAVVAARRSRRDTWTPEVLAVLDRIQQLARHVAALDATGLRMVAADDARAVAGLRADLQRLVTAAPDEARRTELDELTIPLARLHSSLDVVALAPVATPTGEAVIAQGAAVEVHTAVTAITAVLTPKVS